jgi:hypothetical protein
MSDSSAREHARDAIPAQCTSGFCAQAIVAESIVTDARLAHRRGISGGSQDRRQRRSCSILAAIDSRHLAKESHLTIGASLRWKRTRLGYANRDRSAFLRKASADDRNWP